MTEADVSAALTMWREHASSDLPWAEIERALRRLPDSGICAVSDDGTALFMLTPADTVFTVSVDSGKVRLSSRPLDSACLTVSLEWDENSSRWAFGYGDERDVREHWQRISGSVAIDADTGREVLDDREQFARALAGRAGWPDAAPAVGAAAGAPAEERAEDEPRWRAQTDVWGKPLDVKRR